MALYESDTTVMMAIKNFINKSNGRLSNQNYCKVLQYNITTWL